MFNMLSYIKHLFLARKLVVFQVNQIAIPVIGISLNDYIHHPI